MSFAGVRLQHASINDGDSFWVRADATSFVVRLYYADCPETSAFSAGMARRVRDQTRYFGLDGAQETMAQGIAAKTFSHALLAEPFTVHTAFSAGGGSSDSPRFYAFVTLADGRDLAATLIAAGLARAHGAGRPTPDGRAQAAEWDLLRDLEGYAMLRRDGIWKLTDPEHIVAARAQQRDEDAELRRISGRSPGAANDGPVNINVASMEELETVPGIGPVTAAAIIAGRPYSNVADLTRIRGISARRLATFQTSLTTEAVSGTP